MSEMTAEKLESLVKAAVQDAMKVGAMECPDCHASFTEPARYMDHRISEFVTQKFTEAKTPEPEQLIMSCKDGICKLVSEHVEATYDMKKKGEAAPVEEPEGPEEEKAVGLWDGMEDEPEEE